LHLLQSLQYFLYPSNSSSKKADFAALLDKKLVK
jgi:hypothetical protein